MANIEKRINSKGDVTYRVKIRLKGHPVVSGTFTRLTDAKGWIKQTEGDILSGKHLKTIEAKKHTLAEAIDRYTREIMPLKPKSVGRQASQLRWWKTELGAFLLSEITPPRIVECREKLGQELTPRKTKRSPATVVRSMAVLSHLFNVAAREWHWVEDNPMRHVTKPKEPKGRTRFLSDGERDALIKACKESSSPYLFPVVVLAISTGMRHAEIMGLEWRRIDMKRGRAILEETKNGETRVAPLTGMALAELEKLRSIPRIDTDLVFPSPSNPNKPIELRKHWEKALQQAGLENFRFHDLRHTAASYLAMNGATLSEIAAVLGHKTLQMVKRYAHLSESHTHKVVERMNERVFGGLNAEAN